MPWYRIVPKTGNRRYLELPAGPINEHALANVKSISCWPTKMKPGKATPARYSQICPVIFIKSSSAKKIDIYATIKLIGEYYRVDPLIVISESSTGTYIKFQNLFNFNPDYLSATITKRIFEKILVDTVRYFLMEIIPTKVFLELNNKPTLLSFYLNEKNFLSEINISAQDIKHYVDTRRNCSPDDNTPVYLKYLTIFNQILLEGYKSHEETFPYIHEALLRCRYFKKLFQSAGHSFYTHTNTANFCFNLGSVGVSYLLVKIRAILGTVQSNPFDNNANTLCYRIQLALDNICETVSNLKLIKPIRCSKRRFACQSWCGALSPIELLLLKVNYLSPCSRIDKLSAASEAFVQQLPRDRIIFRRAELQTALSKDIRCTYNVDISISHLIATGDITPTKAFVRNFKPGKNTELYILNWQNIQNKIDERIRLTSDLQVTPPPFRQETEEFYSENLLLSDHS